MIEPLVFIMKSLHYLAFGVEGLDDAETAESFLYI